MPVRNLCTIDQEEIKKETRQDPNLPRVIQCICTEWGHEEQCDKVLSTYYKLREELSSVDDLLLRGEVLVPPIWLRHRLIDLAHESRPGIVRTKQRLHEHFCWPRVDIEVDTYIRDCNTCQTNDKTAVTAAAPLQPVPFLSGAWKQIGIDIVGPFYKLPSQFRFAVALVGYFSKWPEVALCNQVTAEAVCEFLIRIFNREWYPKVIVSDHGP